MRTKRLQTRMTTGRFTLPAAFLISAACWLLAAFLLPEIETRPSGYSLWERSNACMPAWADRLLSFILYTLIGYFLIQLNNAFAIIRMRASVQTSVYLLLVAVCPGLHTLHTSDLGAAAFLASLFFLFGSYQHKHPMGSLFHAFLFLGAGSLCFPQLTLFAPLFWIGAYNFQSLQAKSFFASLIGWSVPYWLLLAYAFCSEQMELFYRPFGELANFTPVRFDFQPWKLATLGYLLLLFIVSSMHILLTGYEDKIRTRSYLHFLIGLSFCLFAYIGLQPALATRLLPLLLIGLSILTGHLLVLTHSRSSNGFFLCAFIGLFILFGFNVWTLL